jgi:hypothetical protein
MKMVKKGVMALAGAAALLFGSSVATAQTSAAPLSVAENVRAGAPMEEASNQIDQSVLIGVGVFVVIVIAIYFLAENDDPLSA